MKRQPAAVKSVPKSPAKIAKNKVKPRALSKSKTASEGASLRVQAAINKDGLGLHRAALPKGHVPKNWPRNCNDVYSWTSQLDLFFETVTIFDWHDAEEAHVGTRPAFHIGDHEGQPLLLDKATGQIWRQDPDSEEWVVDGSSLVAWLDGFIASESILYDKDGEFAEDVFDEEGEILLSISALRQRKWLDRDAGATYPRWKLARILNEQGKLDDARNHLERVVEQAPELVWAWFDLAQISKTKGDFAAGLDEFQEAAELAKKRGEKKLGGFFLAHAAAFPTVVNDGKLLAEITKKILQLDPGIVEQFRRGAEENIREKDFTSAMELIDLGIAISPRDVVLIDLRRTCQKALKS